jgi:hypothetical protein
MKPNKCQAVTQSGKPCDQLPSKLVKVLKAEYAMCTMHANLTKKQMSAPGLLVNVPVEIHELP